MAIAKVTLKDLNKYREEIEQLIEVLNETQNGIEQLEKADREIQKEIGEYENASQKCDRILLDLREKLRKLEAKKRRLEKEIRSLKRQIKIVKGEIAGLVTEIADLTAQLASAPVAAPVIVAQLAEKKGQLREQKENLKSLKDRLNMKERELDRTIRNIKTAKGLIEEAEQKKSQIEAGIRDLNAASNNLRRATRELNDLLQQRLRDSRRAVECLSRSREYIEHYIEVRLDDVQYNSCKDMSCNETRKSIQFGELQSDYFVDLLKRSEYSKTIDVSYLTAREYCKIPPEQNGIKREEFGFTKNDLIKEWEKRNGIPWPTYKENVYSPSGKLIRRAGDKYDAHHLQPLTYGGENTRENITPFHALEHFDKQGIHAADSPFGQIEKFYKET